MPMCVIYNPMAARGRAPKRMESLRQALGSGAEFQATSTAGHAEELAFQAAKSGYDFIAAAGGDGTAHEVANGILRANRPDVTFVVFPIGSANDYAFCLGLDCSNGITLKRENVRSVDVGLMRTGDGRERYFINSVGLGFNSAVTVEARKIRWLQGVPLYGLAFLRSLFFHYRCTDMEILFDGTTRRTPTFALTVAIGQREGNLLVTPDALPDDGLFDYLHAGPMSRFEIIRHLPKLAWGGRLPTDHPALWMGRCKTVRVRSAAALQVHMDGEIFVNPADGICELEIMMLPGRLRVQG